MLKKKPDLLLLPGLMCDYSLWDYMVEDLYEIGNIHFGDLYEGQTIDSIAKKILKSAPREFCLIGFSLGGYVANAITRIAPNRVTFLILINTSSRASTDWEIDRNSKTIQTINATSFRGLSSFSISNSIDSNNKYRESIIEHIQIMSERLGKAVFLRQLSLIRTNTFNELKNIRCPALVVTSDNDRLRSRKEAEELVNCIPDAKLAIINNCGHMTPLERPQELSHIIQSWLLEQQKHVFSKTIRKGGSKVK